MKIERTRIFSTTFSLPSPSSDLKVANGGEKGKTPKNPSIFFRKWRLGKRDANTYERKTRSGNCAFFYIFSTRNHSRENSPFSISCFVLFLHLVVKPSGMNFTIFPLIFIPKSRPCVLHTNLKQ